MPLKLNRCLLHMMLTRQEKHVQQLQQEKKEAEFASKKVLETAIPKTQTNAAERIAIIKANAKKDFAAVIEKEKKDVAEVEENTSKTMEAAEREVREQNQKARDIEKALDLLGYGVE